MLLQTIKATWDKTNLEKAAVQDITKREQLEKTPVRVPVNILAFTSIGVGNDLRPVAIIEDISDDNKIRYAELRYLKVDHS